jgi:hypothetical protein
LAVHRAGAAEHDHPAGVISHRRKQGAAASDVHIPVAEGILHGFTHRLEAGEIHHTFDRVGGCRKRPLKVGAGADVALNNLEPTIARGQMCQLQHPTQRFGVAVAEVVEHHQVVPCLKQHQAGVAPDEPGSPGDQQLGHHGSNIGADLTGGQKSPT